MEEKEPKQFFDMSYNDKWRCVADLRRSGSEQHHTYTRLRVRWQHVSFLKPFPDFSTNMVKHH